MLCPSCQRRNPEGARFCNGCGGPLSGICPSCHHVNPAEAAFCNACGSSLGGSAAESPAQDPRAYTPSHLAERILHSRSALEGERKHVTVLFCDLADSTRIAERLGADTMHEIMDRCFALILDQVHRYEGTVNQFLGDGVMALFGAPLALEDAPHRAVTAALAIHRALEPLGDELRRRFGIEFEMRIGIHSGPVVVGSIGDDLRMDYTAVGDTTNLASRLQGLARPGMVLVSDATASLIQGWFDLECLGDLEVKGRAEHVIAHRVVGERPVLERVQARAATGLTPLVGRGPELAALERAYESAADGHGQVVFLVGDAGIGKSRLRYELQQRLADRDPLWVEGRCMTYARDFPFHPIVDGLRRFFGIDATDDDATALAKIDAVEAKLGGELEWTLPYVRLLLSLPSGDAAVDELDAATRRSETFRALAARNQRASERAPFVLVIEDIHWIDRASEEFLAYMIDAIPRSRMLLILTHRPGYRQPFGDRSYHLRLALQPLSRREMGEMAEAMLDSSAVPLELSELIASRAEGNPFFVEEVTQSLLEDGSLRVEDGRITLARDLGSISVPDSIQDVLMARLDRLDDAPKRALQVGAVIGREFALKLLERIVEAGDRLGPVIDELRALELIYEKAAYPELAFMFKHALTRDVAYDSVLVGRRKTLHRIVATAIEELYQDRLTEQVEHLAHHFTAAEVWEKAFFYRVLAARKAAEAFANQSAVEHCRRALEIAARPDVQVPDETRRELEVTQGMAGAAMSEFRDSGEAFLRAAALSTEPADEALNYGRAAHSFFWGHLYDELIDAVESAEEISLAHGLDDGLAFGKAMRAFRDAILGEHSSSRRLIEEASRLEPRHPEVRIVLGYLRGEQAEWEGEYRTAAAAQLEAVELARKHRLPGLLLPSQWFGAKALCCLGEYGEALRQFREACDLSERIGDRAQLARMLNTLGWLHAELGSDELAAEYNQRSARLAEEMLDLGLVAGTPEIHGNASVNLACNRIALGDLDGADEALDSVRRDLEADGDPWMRWRYALHRCDAEARLALSRGDPVGALRWLEEEAVGGRSNGSRKVEARALELRGRALLHMDDRDAARKALHVALKLARTIGYPPVQWRALSLLGEIDRRQGDGSAADDSLDRAAGIIENLSGSLEQAELRRRFLALSGRLRENPLTAFR